MLYTCGMERVVFFLLDIVSFLGGGLLDFAAVSIIGYFLLPFFFGLFVPIMIWLDKNDRGYPH